MENVVDFIPGIIRVQVFGFHKRGVVGLIYFGAVVICHFFLDEKVNQKIKPICQPKFSLSHILPRRRAGKIPVRSKSAGQPTRPWMEIWPKHRFADSGECDFARAPRLVFSPT
jgi:hypothetical protein